MRTVLCANSPGLCPALSCQSQNPELPPDCRCTHPTNCHSISTPLIMLDIRHMLLSDEARYIEVGLFMAVVCIAEICVNALVLYAVVAGRLWKGRGSPIYIIAASNLAVDIIQLLIHAVYLVPCITANRFIYQSGRDGFANVFFSSVFMFCWYHTSLNQTLTAINRVLVICFSWRSFDTARVLTVCAAVYPLALALTLCSQHFFPCCKFSFDPAFYSYSYSTLDGVANWSNMMDIPLNNTSSLICVMSYVWIVLYMRKCRKNLSTALPPAVSLRKKNKEYRYAMQFCAISVFYLLAWVTFRVFPPLIADSGPIWYSLVALCVIVNSGANGFTYLYTNREVQRELRKSIFRLVASDSSNNFLHPHSNTVDSAAARKQQTIALLQIKKSASCASHTAVQAHL